MNLAGHPSTELRILGIVDLESSDNVILGVNGCSERLLRRKQPKRRAAYRRSASLGQVQLIRELGTALILTS